LRYRGISRDIYTPNWGRFLIYLKISGVHYFLFQRIRFKIDPFHDLLGGWFHLYLNRDFFLFSWINGSFNYIDEFAPHKRTQQNDHYEKSHQ